MPDGDRLLSSGDEAGTAPDDRRFRPDVEGLRAVAVLLVVCYHAGVPRVTGGYIGVDVFFVISGFVITGLLLRERRSSGKTSIVNFYARRVRRILPAATLTIVVTVVASYILLGYVSGNLAADDGRWAAAFLSNFHFEAVGTNYFTAKLPPSPLQNFWSLSVEEQFYVVYPTLFLIVAGLKRGYSVQAKMAVALVLVIIASFCLSVVQTATQPTAAYFSPLTRAWELALGALVAVATPWLRRIPATAATLATWCGLALISVAALVFTAQMPYPGSLVAIPVLGAALVIAGGVAAPRAGAERLLGLRPFQWFGKRSYSLYLWHWPILIIAAERVGKSTLPLRQNLVLVLLAIVIAMASFRLVESPIRHWRLPPKTSVMAGVATVAATVAGLSLAIAVHSTPSAASLTPASSLHAVLRDVREARSIVHVPSTIAPPLATAAGDYGGFSEPQRCVVGLGQSTAPLCPLGDVHGRHLLVVYGDSHAVMWLPAFNAVAKHAHMRLLVLGKPACPAALITVADPQGAGPYTACDRWHTWAVKTIDRLAPSILVVSQDSLYSTPKHGGFSASQWADGLTKLFHSVPRSTRTVFLGNIPLLPQSPPTCLSAHLDDAQACSMPVTRAYRRMDTTEFLLTQSLHIRYIDPTPWFCSTTCTAVVASYDVYMDRFHVSATYAAYLQRAVADALLSPTAPPTHFQQVRTSNVVRPSAGATISGTYDLAATAVLGSSHVVRVDFRLSGQGLHDHTICVSSTVYFVWPCAWNSASVPNGRYRMQSVAFDAAGNSVTSPSVSVVVKN